MINEIVEQDSSLIMVSADVELLFLRVIPETDYETIDICANIIYNQQDAIGGINKEEIRNL